ncbi:MAG: transglutaminase domain-containing protein [Chthonomonadales bacterium]
MAPVETVQPVTSPPDAAQTTPASIPFYVAAFIVTICGLYAVDLSLGDPSFSSLVIGLTIAGFIVSFVSRRRNIAPKNIEIPALFVCACLFFIAVVTDPSQSFLAPAGVAEDRSKSLAVLLTWLTVFRSFTLLNDGTLLFSCVPTIALLGLVGTNTSDPVLVTDFIVFSGAAIFMMVHENYLRIRHFSPVRIIRSKLNLFNQVVIVGLCLIASMFFANLITPFVQRAGSSLRLTAGINLNNRNAANPQSAPTSTEDKSEVPVGTGPVTLSDTLLLKVKANDAENLRTASYDRYTGRGWQNSQNIQAQLIPSSTPESNPSTDSSGIPRNFFYYQIPPFDQSQQYTSSHNLEQTISIVAGSYLELPYGGEIRTLGTTDSRVRLDSTGGIHLTDPLITGSYEVKSDIPDLSQESQTRAPGNYDSEVTGKYLQLPTMKANELQALQDLSRQITSDVRSAYGKIKAIEQYVGASCKYNTNAASFPVGTDVAYHFLTVSKQGYCDAFATSVAILCRCAGIPARVASGFICNEKDSKTNDYLVRDRDRHLWAEVYLNGFGWKAFDATGLAEDISGKEELTVKPKSTIGAWLFKKGILPPLAALAFALLIAYVVKVELIDRFRKKETLNNPLGLPATNYQIIREYESAARLLARRGWKRSESETIREFATRANEALSVEMPGIAVAFTDLSAIANEFRYSTIVATETDVIEASTLRSSIEIEMKRRRRLSAKNSLKPA